MSAESYLSDLKFELPDVEMKLAASDSWLGNSGALHVYPTSEDEIASLLKYANKHGKKITIQGNGTKRGFGGLIESYDILLSLSKYSGVIEHSVSDMIVTVKSGTTFGELQAVLAKHHQRVTLDPSWPEDATIGGIIGANDSGPKRLGYGSARDVVAGLRVIYPDGTVIRTGGKVVKNVAGYDMNKCFIGSMGTIGVMTEITLKLRPMPQSESLVLISFQDSMLDELRAFVVKQLDAMIEPVSLELLNPSLAERLTGGKQLTLAVGFEDAENAVVYQENKLKQAVPEQATVRTLRDEELRAFWKQFYDIGFNGLTTRHDTDDIEASLKTGLKNMDVLQAIQDCHLLEERHHVTVYAHGGAGHGLCQMIMKGSRANVVSAIHAWRAAIRKLKGYVVVKHIPLSLRQNIDVWGEKPEYFFLLEGIKSKIDPHRTLNDRRFIGGI